MHKETNTVAYEYKGKVYAYSKGCSWRVDLGKNEADGPYGHFDNAVDAVNVLSGESDYPNVLNAKKRSMLAKVILPKSVREKMATPKSWL